MYNLRSFVIALVLIASAVSPAHSAALGCVVLLLNLAIPADLFVAFVVAPQPTLLLIMTHAPIVAAPGVKRDICHQCMSGAYCALNGLNHPKKCTEDTVSDFVLCGTSSH